MVGDFFVMRLRNGQDEDLREWLNALPPGSRSAMVRSLIRWALRSLAAQNEILVPDVQKVLVNRLR